MIKIIAKKDFVLNDKKYIAGDEIEINNIEAISKLNEKGFIEPLSYKDLVILEREIQNKKNEL